MDTTFCRIDYVTKFSEYAKSVCVQLSGNVPHVGEMERPRVFKILIWFLRRTPWSETT